MSLVGRLRVSGRLFCPPSPASPERESLEPGREYMTGPESVNLRVCVLGLKVRVSQELGRGRTERSTSRLTGSSGRTLHPADTIPL